MKKEKKGERNEAAGKEKTRRTGERKKGGNHLMRSFTNYAVHRLQSR
jgi:hypothetical protein